MVEIRPAFGYGEGPANKIEEVEVFTAHEHWYDFCLRTIALRGYDSESTRSPFPFRPLRASTEIYIPADECGDIARELRTICTRMLHTNYTTPLDKNEQRVLDSDMPQLIATFEQGFYERVGVNIIT